MNRKLYFTGYVVFSKFYYFRIFLRMGIWLIYQKVKYKSGKNPKKEERIEKKHCGISIFLTENSS